MDAEPQSEQAEVSEAKRVQAALDALEAQGARAYDAPACDCVRALLTRAEELGGATANILVGRAESHVESLRERFARDQERIAARVTALEERAGSHVELRQALERGELTRVARTVRRLAMRPVSKVVRPVSASPELAPENAQPRESNDTRGTRRKRAMSYEDSVAELVASFALARAVDVVPEDAGPYNPLRIASETLDSMRALSPFYLTVQLNRLEELATLLALPELPQKQEEKALPKKKRGSLKG
jgi:hypothetical protein